MIILKIIHLYKTFLSTIEIFFIILTKKISGYPSFVNKFEKNFIKYINAKYGVIFSNGTSALEAILFSLNLNKKDEILVPSLTFFSTITPIVHTKANLRFLDIDLNNLNLSIQDLENKINKNTKVVIIVHIYGMPVNMNNILKLKRKFGFYLIEDCSHSHGAKFANKFLGTFGDSSFFSFQGNKSIAAGEAGIAITQNRKTFEILQSYGHFGRFSGKFTNKNLKKIQFTGFGKKTRPNPLGIVLANNDLKFLSIYNSICEKNRKICIKIINNSKYFRTTHKLANMKMGGYYRGFPIYPKQEYLLNINIKIFSKLVSSLISKKIKIFYLPNISNHNEPLLKYNNYLDFFFNNKQLSLSNKNYLKNTEDLQDKVFFIDLRQSFSMLKISKIKNEIMIIEKEIKKNFI